MGRAGDTLLKSGGEFFPRQRFDKHQTALRIIVIFADSFNNLHIKRGNHSQVFLNKAVLKILRNSQKNIRTVQSFAVNKQTLIFVIKIARQYISLQDDLLVCSK